MGAIYPELASGNNRRSQVLRAFNAMVDQEVEVAKKVLRQHSSHQDSGR